MYLIPRAVLENLVHAYPVEALQLIESASTTRGPLDPSGSPRLFWCSCCWKERVGAFTRAIKIGPNPIRLSQPSALALGCTDITQHDVQPSTCNNNVARKQSRVGDGRGGTIVPPPFPYLAPLGGGINYYYIGESLITPCPSCVSFQLNVAGGNVSLRSLIHYGSS